MSCAVEDTACGATESAAWCGGEEQGHDAPREMLRSVSDALVLRLTSGSEKE